MTGSGLLIRREKLGDEETVRSVHEQAFDRPDEARLVDSLRAVPGSLSVVALLNERLVGQIQFSPAVLEAERDRFPLAALGPMAVLPEMQRQGIGSALVHDGLAACRDAGWRAVMVLGHPAYYPRFGFRPGHGFGIRSEYRVPNEVFMVLELEPDALRGREGLARYHPAFAGL